MYIVHFDDLIKLVIDDHDLFRRYGPSGNKTRLWDMRCWTLQLPHEKRRNLKQDIGANSVHVVEIFEITCRVVNSTLHDVQMCGGS